MNKYNFYPRSERMSSLHGMYNFKLYIYISIMEPNEIFNHFRNLHDKHEFRKLANEFIQHYYEHLP